MSADRNRKLLYVREVARVADSFYDDGARFGDWAAEAGLNRSQITGLESVANSTLKVADVLDYLKKQTARSKPDRDWRHRLQPEAGLLGPALITYLSATLRDQRDAVCAAVAARAPQAAPANPSPDPYERQEVHLALIREFVRQVAAHYEMRARG